MQQLHELIIQYQHEWKPSQTRPSLLQLSQLLLLTYEVIQTEILTIEMHEQQKGLCAICQRENTQKSRKKGEICRLAIDHCHETGKVRGLLCGACNKGLGHFEDDIELLLTAIIYLEAHKHIE